MMNGLKTARGWMLGVCAAAAAVGACGKGAPSPAETGASASAQIGANGEKYPAPRWPSYFKAPKDAAELMPAARLLARNQSGLQGKGLGILKEGDKVLIVPGDEADPMVMDAVKKALEERKITPYITYAYELKGSTKEQAHADRQRRTGGQDIENAGIYQATAWITGQFPNPSQPAQWLRQKDPQTFAALFPGKSADAVLTASGQKPKGEGAAGADTDTGQATSGGGDYKARFAVGDAIKDFLTKHPDGRGVYWGKGGSTGLPRQLYPLQGKFLGTFLPDNR